MEADAPQPAVKFILLLLLDGRLCCVSLADGEVRWETQLPGGPLFHCGPRHQSKREKRLWAQTPSRVACRSCRSMSIGVSGTGDQPEKALGNELTDCSLVFIPSELTKDDISLMQWHFFVTSNLADKRSVWVPAEEVLECWNASACPSHRALDLQQRATSHMELDFFSGKLLVSLSAEAKHIDDKEDTVSNEVSSTRVILRRTDHTRSMVFPPLQATSHPTVDSSVEAEAEEEEEEASRSWYATASTVALDVLDTSLDAASPSNAWLHAEQHSFFIEQTVTLNGVISCLHVAGGSEGVAKLQLTDLKSPLVSAQILCWEPLTAASNGADGTSQLRCQKIPVVTSWGHVDLTPGSIWSLQGRDGHVQEISGVLYGNGRILFAECIAPKNEVASTSTGSEAAKSPGLEPSSPRLSMTHGAENGHFFPGYEDSSETDSSAASGYSGNAIVLHNSSAAFHNGTDTGAPFHTGNEISFFDDNFEVITLLGRGASGAVLLTQHRLTGIFYAVKVMLMRDCCSKDNALREVRLHAILHHQYLARYYACWSEALTPYRVQQLASVGLCKPSSIQDKSAINSSGRIGWLNHEQGEPSYLNSGANCLLPLGTQVMNHKLIMAPPGTMHGSGAGMYLAGGDSLDSVCDYSSQKHDDDEGDECGGSSLNDIASSVSSTPEKLLSSHVIFLQMEYCQTTLAHRLGSRSSIDRVENIIIALQIFSALRYVHRRDCLHRDVKPTNVFLDYTCQSVGVDDTSDDDGSDDDEDDAAFAASPSTKIHDANAFGDDEARNTLKLRDPDLSPALPTPILSAFELLKSNASVGLLAIYLKRLKDAQGEAEKRKAIRSVRRWLKFRLVQARLGDFGLAKPLGDQHIEAARYFDRGAINTVGVGSPLYSSPEQLEGDVCTPATDAFAAGVLLAEMYIQPKTVSERLVELKRAREGVFPCPSLLLDYPELQVVKGLTRKDPSARMTLRDAGRFLARALDKTLFTFLSS
ncbi:putative protein kinase [Trypanosoma conorhini]|uniref:Protein kinase domain-containing protein n=1 Tax=Trypanosoma conorhini TaxID=83891 RepID=A0A3R7LEP1_9TRYP|nr:putative protein kinase [Trypanosoma conorhini]RNF25730.1 putative protein kinase [Trypanosoma conorhini]